MSYEHNGFVVECSNANTYSHLDVLPAIEKTSDDLCDARSYTNASLLTQIMQDQDNQ